MELYPDFKPPKDILNALQNTEVYDLEIKVVVRPTVAEMCEIEGSSVQMQNLKLPVFYENGKPFGSELIGKDNMVATLPANTQKNTFIHLEINDKEVLGEVTEPRLFAKYKGAYLIPLTAEEWALRKTEIRGTKDIYL